MGDAYFYQITTSTLEMTLSTLCTKAQARGWRIALRGRDGSQLAALDQSLWSADDESFLPHGLAGGPHDDVQPVLLTLGGCDGRDCLVLVDGADFQVDEVRQVQRACVVFDGNDPHAVQRAREQWKVIAAAGLSAQYWNEADGRWQKKAETSERTPNA